MLQKRIIRIVNKKPFDAHTDPLFRDSKFLKFIDIYSLHLGKCMYSYNNNLLPPSFSNILLRTNQVHSYNTRGSNQYYIPFCRTNIRKFSIIYQGPVFFNKLCSDILNNYLSLYSFQSKIKNYFLSCY